ncbi:Cytochrome b2, mitochondrial [Psilocybe cubensis]|uniref:Cytochrome b2, mitochondrial n=2 Tax=Psilocybe cubensis TaxID=181762 RepID=A0ACB8HGF8_PSICU|nr:Cytochrome b2, mitochondrial [Psilocybe cubensis]KAH9486795.1 Cytochrome b2, mitochondrial [Psilocybe cubensis]
MPSFTLQQVAQHKSQNSCWVIIKNKVYDVTEFLPEHPGGAAIILKYGGRDATSAYEPIHPPDALDKNLPASKHLGYLNGESINILQQEKLKAKKTKDERRVELARQRMPPLSRILSLMDMENVARQVLSHKALAYYSSASDDEITNSENARAFTRFFFRARVMRAVAHCDPSTTILGFRSSIPVFVSGAALAKLGHPDGELNITRAACKEGIIQMISSNSSFSAADIMASADQSQTLFFQLYKHRDDDIAERRVREMENLGYKAIFLTVDAIVAGNRERDIRSPWILEEQESGPVYFASGTSDEPKDGVNVFGTAGALVANDDRDMTWEKTIPWLRSITKLPIVIKGIQCVEDAILAAEAKVDGILLSNHGARCSSLPPLEVLYSIRQQHPEIFDKLEDSLFSDPLAGGIRRGTDIIKAVCLGAKAVGLGRPFLYAQSAYGQSGVSKIIEILRREVVTAMRLVGASTIRDLRPEMVQRVDWHPHVHVKL